MISSFVGLTAAALLVIVLLVGLLIVNRKSRRRLVQLAHELRAGETRWRELAERLPAGIFEMDPTGKRTFGNQRLLDILGIAVGDEDLRVSLVHPEDRREVRRRWRDAARTGKAMQARFRVVRRNDSQLRWVAVEAAPEIVAGRLVGWSGSVIDVTADEEEAARLRRLTEIVEATPDLVAMVDANGRFTYANAAARRFLGVLPSDGLLAHRVADIYAPHERSRFFSEAVSFARQHGVWSGEIDLATTDGDTVRVSQVLISHQHDDSTVDYFSTITRDLSERRAFEQQLDAVQRFDTLTGLAHRATLVDGLGQALDRSRRTVTPLAVLVVDLDNFQLINDSLGHDSGDEVLIETARRLVAGCGPHAVVGRLAADEFAVVISGVADVAAGQLAVAVAESISKPIRLANGDDVFVTASIGLCCSTGDPLRTPESLLRDAGTAMQRAKERGRARVERYVEDYRQTAVRRLRTVNDLHRALTGGELRVAYQPEVELATGHVVGVEALVRWQHPERGIVPPSEFIPLAEQSGMIGEVGTFVLDEAIRQAASWTRARYDGSPVLVWVNLSARQLVDAGLVDSISAMLARHEVSPAQLGLEITESALLADFDAGLAALHALHALGIQLAVDDFGTGFSSLSYLKQLPVDVVKIDRSFVNGLRGDSEDSAIVAAIAEMARALRLATVAEGVETAEQLSTLRALGCKIGQGFLFATPQTAERVSRLLLLDRRSPVGRFTPTVVDGLTASAADGVGVESIGGRAENPLITLSASADCDRRDDPPEAEAEVGVSTLKTRKRVIGPFASPLDFGIPKQR